MPDNDYDGDGYNQASDCDDWDPAVNPGQAEVLADGIDQDCDGADWSFEAIGRSHSCYLRSDNGIDCVGDNSFGQLDAPEGQDFVSIAVGNDHSCALDANQRMYCWGSDAHGQTTPPFLAPWSELSARLNYTVARFEDTTVPGGVLLCFGDCPQGN